MRLSRARRRVLRACARRKGVPNKSAMTITQGAAGAPAMPKKAPGERASIALGTMNFGKRTPARESERIVRRALERGIHIFDTANFYNAGESERLLARALGRDRDRAIVITKAGLGLVPGKPEGLSPAAMESQLRGSLERLGASVVDIDIYLLHVPDRATPIEQTIAGMQALVASGRVRSWGASNYAAWELLEMSQLADARGLARPVVTQVLYNAVHRQLDVEYFAFARRRPIHTMAYNALAGGLLTGRHAEGGPPEKGSRFDGNAMYQRRYWNHAMFARVAQIRAIADREGCSAVELGYAWLAQHPGVDSILVGPATEGHLDAALDAVERRLSRETIAAVNDLAREWNATDTNYVR
jgi:aryl-alcohol dehydrogenase-like predicted oxidoreductase